MPVSVIIGGQYGSEGKGKVSHYFSKKYQASAVVRVGGPNSGHTVINSQGAPLIFKHLPTACILTGPKSVLTSGNYINLDILEREIEISKIDPSDLLIDPYAAIITNEDIENERNTGLVDRIGSTGCGLGSALVNRVSRNDKAVFAKDIEWLHKYLTDTNLFLRSALDRNERIIIEGTQGFGLSLLHSNHYPFLTGRDTTAAGFLSEAGLSPLDVDDIIMVIRTFPIRVSGNSGPLKNETTWEEVSSQSGSEILFNEFTSVSKKLRRVGLFEEDIILKAIRYNKPTKIVLNHVDYLDINCKSGTLTEKTLSDIKSIERRIKRQIDYIGIGRSEFSIIEHRSGKSNQDSINSLKLI